MRWSEWLHARVGRTDSIALVRLMELLFEFLTGELQPRTGASRRSALERLSPRWPAGQTQLPEGPPADRQPNAPIS